MAGFTLDDGSRRRLERVLTDAAKLFGSPKPILHAMGVETLAWVGETFRDGGRPAWEPLKPSTLAGRRQGKGGTASGGRPLQDNGKLRDSFEEKLLTDSRVEIGSDDPRAVWHNFGTHPYVIRPKDPNGVLAFAAVLPGAEGGTVGQRTLSGLGRSRGTSSGSFVLPAGRSLRGRRGGQRIQPFKNVAFAREVHHPGLPARPMLPTPEQIVPRLVEAGTRLIQHRVGQR